MGSLSQKSLLDELRKPLNYVAVVEDLYEISDELISEEVEGRLLPSPSLALFRRAARRRGEDQRTPMPDKGLAKALNVSTCTFVRYGSASPTLRAGWLLLVPWKAPP